MLMRPHILSDLHLEFAHLDLPQVSADDFALRALAEFFCSTGVRAKEATGLNLSSINWEERSVQVLGKGRKERGSSRSGGPR